MTKNTVQAFQLLLLFLAFVAGGSWCVTEVRRAILWSLRVGTPLMGLMVGFYFYKCSRRPEALPDLLGDTAGTYFEQDGFCFAFLVQQINGVCRLNIYFQNRYAGHASAKVTMLPPLRTLGLGRHPLPRIEVEVECPGGAFGVVRVPFPIPAKYQGKRLMFNAGADVRYGCGRGKLLRFRAGRNAPSIARTGQSGWGIIGAIQTASQATAKLQLPTNVSSESNGLNVETEILWAPDLATGGFPIVPARTAA